MSGGVSFTIAHLLEKVRNMDTSNYFSTIDFYKEHDMVKIFAHFYLYFVHFVLDDFFR